jgi:hypothetical protein
MLRALYRWDEKGNSPRIGGALYGACFEGWFGTLDEAKAMKQKLEKLVRLP